MSRLGLITIGQAPRPDIAADVQPLLGTTELVEAGALDGLAAGELAALAPGPGDELLVTKLADGTPVRVAHSRIMPRVASAANRALAAGADRVLVMCTAELASADLPAAVYTSEEILRPAVSALARGRRLGVVVPDDAQREQAHERWAASADTVQVGVADPYGPQATGEVVATCAALAESSELIVLDCMGYSAAMGSRARQQCGAAVVVARTLVVRVVLEALPSERSRRELA